MKKGKLLRNRSGKNERGTQYNIYIYMPLYIYIYSGIYFYGALSERYYKVDVISRTCDVSRALEKKLAFSRPPLSKLLKQSFSYGGATNGQQLGVSELTRMSRAAVFNA